MEDIFKPQIFKLANGISVLYLGFAKFHPILLQFSAGFPVSFIENHTDFLKAENFLRWSSCRMRSFPCYENLVTSANTIWLLRNCKNSLHSLQDTGIIVSCFKIYLKKNPSSFSFSSALLTTSKMHLSVVSKIGTLILAWI